MRILVGLDELIDTRLGTISTMSQPAAAGLIGPHYWCRMHDDWHKLTLGDIDNDEFKERYANRNVDTLKASVVSMMAMTLTHLCKDQLNRCRSDPREKLPVVYLNTYPYQLTVAETSAYVNMLEIYLGNLEFEVKVVCHSIPQLSPALIKSEYDVVILYDINSWLECHYLDLPRHPMPSRSLIYPAISFKGELDETKAVIDGRPVDPWQLTKEIMIEFVSMDPIDSVHFSIMPPVDETADKPSETPHTSESEHQSPPTQEPR